MQSLWQGAEGASDSSGNNPISSPLELAPLPGREREREREMEREREREMERVTVVNDEGGWEAAAHAHAQQPTRVAAHMHSSTHAQQRIRTTAHTHGCAHAQ